jgi:hypothetical protein
MDGRRLRREGVEELLDRARERLRVLEHRRVSAVGHEPERCQRDAVEEPDRHAARCDPVVSALTAALPKRR